MGVGSFGVFGEEKVLSRLDGRAIAEGIATALASRPGVRVLETAQVDRLIAEHRLGATGLLADDGTRVGAFLMPDLLIVGSAQAVPGRIRLLARLTDTRTAETVTGLSAEGPEGDLFRLEEELSARMWACMVDRVACRRPE